MGELATIQQEPMRQQAAAITPAQMLSIAVEQGADLAKIEKLMDLQERWERTQAVKEYNAAIAAFRAECPTIERRMKGHNDRKYSGLADALDQIGGLLAKHGLSHSWRTAQEGNQITVTCVLSHAGGHQQSTPLSALPDTSGSKNAIQAVGSTVSYLQRYTLFSLLGLASKEADDDGHAAGGDHEVSAACDQLLAADDVKKLQAMAKEAVEKYPKGRGQLTAAYNQRKRELQGAVK